MAAPGDYGPTPSPVPWEGFRPRSGWGRFARGAWGEAPQRTPRDLLSSRLSLASDPRRVQDSEGGAG